MPSAPTDDFSDPPDNEEVETTFRRLRRNGHSRLEALRMILDVLDVSLAEAKRLLASNDTWAEVHAATGGEEGATGNEEETDDPIPPAPG